MKNNKLFYLIICFLLFFKVILTKNYIPTDKSQLLNSLAAEFDNLEEKERSFVSYNFYEPAKKGPFLYEFKETKEQWKHALWLLNYLREKMGSFKKLRWNERMAKEIKGEEFREKRAYHSVLKKPARMAEMNLRLGIKQIFLELVKYLQCNSSRCQGKPFVKNGEQYTMPYAFIDYNPTKIGCRGRLFKKKHETKLRISILCKTNTGTSDKTKLFDLKKVSNQVIRKALKRVTKSEEKKKIELERINIVNAQVEAIVDFAYRDLLPGNNKGINGAIHRAAGVELSKYIKKHFSKGVNVGSAVITPSFKIKESGKGRAQSIIFSIAPKLQKYAAPTKKQKKLLASCYTKSLKLAVKHKIRSIAFPPIAVGHHNFPKEEAAKIAVKVVSFWLKKAENAINIDNIKFVVYKSDEEFKIYHTLLTKYMTNYYTRKYSNTLDTTFGDLEVYESNSKEKKKENSNLGNNLSIDEEKDGEVNSLLGNNKQKKKKRKKNTAKRRFLEKSEERERQKSGANSSGSVETNILDASKDNSLDIY